LAFALVARRAAADVPPSPELVETCSIDVQQSKLGAGESCRTCTGSWRAAVNDCGRLPAGLTKRCRTYGALQWTEVWCGVPVAAAASASASAAASVAPSASASASATASAPSTDGGAATKSAAPPPAPPPASKSSCAASHGPTSMCASLVIALAALGLGLRRGARRG
jgi:hypothetical protein